MRCPQVQVTVNLDQVRAAAEAIRAQTRVGLIAVIKADAYGLGAPPIADALASVVNEFAYFAVAEAREVGRPGLVLGPPDGEPAEYRELNLRPAVANRAMLQKFAGMRVAIKVDTGMQRFGCPAEDLDDLVARGDIEDFFSHAVTLEAIARLRRACAGRGRPLHAAATCLLDYPEAWFDAVRPGLALYRGAVRVTTRLQSVRDTSGPIGYTGFRRPRVGIILAGYSNLVQPAPVLINGRLQRLLEVGMNTCFVSVEPTDKLGDEVVLLGDGLTEAALAEHLGVREHEILCRYTAMGPRHYVSAGVAHGAASMSEPRPLGRGLARPLRGGL
jgi:alanine racemase